MIGVWGNSFLAPITRSQPAEVCLTSWLFRLEDTLKATYPCALQITTESLMSDETPKSEVSTSSPVEPPQPTIPNRSDLIQKARSFLQSPQVRAEDYAAKRRFLSEKGLNDVEIDSLLQETVIISASECKYLFGIILNGTVTQVSQPPLVPPRTYPQPPPSNLPNLLIGLARILSWLAGGSAAFLLLYFVSTLLVVILA